MIRFESLKRFTVLILAHSANANHIYACCLGCITSLFCSFLRSLILLNIVILLFHSYSENHYRILLFLFYIFPFFFQLFIVYTLFSFRIRDIKLFKLSFFCSIHLMVVALSWCSSKRLWQISWKMTMATSTTL